ncbi:2,3-diaminopropionate biosynthesis protein SbnB [Niallia taxi]|uniref:2,3-diaminopropionate biosynthesis protein SbnB n=1 Tax=Niallia taxi TaxID=2499688 RepID=UPI00203D61AB|nr:2,3-diaminopropionate biosynthesis protein SbnB [Niallia taxi]MCM3216684.1 2,3-diaminopropionate biosynthesis protein SbnB [Niallia taxi]
MKYLSDNEFRQMDTNWKETISCIEKAVQALDVNDYAQPVKPYLRYNNMKNRIIAMPAYVGQDIHSAGIKWIASFPDNIKKNIPRANCVVVLNNADTGEVKSIINTPLISIIRTASVSGLIMKNYLNQKSNSNFNIGIIGWGPIGQQHYQMATTLLGDKIKKIYVYDLKEIDQENLNKDNRIVVCKDWKEAYLNSDIVMTCTVSDRPYINEKPKTGALLLNVSLRDYTSEVYEYVKDTIIVDNWKEVCREDTDVERFSLEKGLNETMVKTITDIVCRDGFKDYNQDNNVMFNPMGMAVFDIALAEYYYKKSKELNIGQDL